MSVNSLRTGDCCLPSTKLVFCSQTLFIATFVTISLSHLTRRIFIITILKIMNFNFLLLLFAITFVVKFEATTTID